LSRTSRPPAKPPLDPSSPTSAPSASRPFRFPLLRIYLGPLTLPDPSARPERLSVATIPTARRTALSSLDAAHAFPARRHVARRVSVLSELPGPARGRRPRRQNSQHSWPRAKGVGRTPAFLALQVCGPPRHGTAPAPGLPVDPLSLPGARRAVDRTPPMGGEGRQSARMEGQQRNLEDSRGRSIP
jgi:hypothetical protein